MPGCNSCSPWTIAWMKRGHGQGNTYATANRSVPIARAREVNAFLVHHYSWNRRELAAQGQVTDTRIDRVSHGPSWQLPHQSGKLLARSVRDAKCIEVPGDEELTLRLATPKVDEWAMPVQEALAARMKRGGGN